MSIKYRVATPEDFQKLGAEFVGVKISIFWDGDNVYYPCTVVRYDSEKDEFFVKYDSDKGDVEHCEDLRNGKWKVAVESVGKLESQYKPPTIEEKIPGAPLDGAYVEIFWDGDSAFFEGRVTKYVADTQKYDVLYDGEEIGSESQEDLQNGTWRIWRGTETEVLEYKAAKKKAADKEKKKAMQAASNGAIGKSSGHLTYLDMVFETIVNLNDKGGSSLQSIRKYMLDAYNLKSTHSASFNNLTMKALTKALETGDVEQVPNKRAYKVSAAYKDRLVQEQKRAAAALREAQKAAMRPAPKPMTYSKAAAASAAKASSSSSSGAGRSRGGNRGRQQQFDSAAVIADPLFFYYGTAAANNKTLRKELISFRNKRDKFLERRIKLLKPFLLEKNYFVRKEKIEAEKKVQRELEKKQKAEAALLKAVADERVAAAAAAQAEAKAESDALAVAATMAAMTAEICGDAVTFVQQQQSLSQSTGIKLEGEALGVVPTSAAPSAVPTANNTSSDAGFGSVVMSDTPAVETTVAVAPAVIATSAEVKQEAVASTVDVLPAAAAVAATVPQSGEAVDPSSETVGSLKTDNVAVEEEEQQQQSLVEVAPAKVENADDDGEDVADLSDLQLLYSTMAGVKMLQQPPILRANLHEHQVQGISWMVHMFQNGMPMILGDQMGLGKTLQSIGFLAYLHHTLRKRGPHLVVVPLSVLSNWISEFEAFCPTLRAVRFHGPKEERNRIKSDELADLNEFDVVVTTYEIIVSEVNYFRRKYVWTTIIVDEGHRLKNEKSQLSEKLRMVACLSKVILSGTPMQNNLKELWGMLYFLAPDVFQVSKPFEDGFDLARGHIDTAVLRRARKLLSIFMLRRVKDNVSIRLPNRKELTMLVPLTSQQVTLYKALLTGLDGDTMDAIMNMTAQSSSSGEDRGGTMAAAGAAAGGGDSNDENNSSSGVVATTAAQGPGVNDSQWRRLMNLLLQLRKICNHTYLMPEIAPEPYTIDERLVGGSGKLLMLDRMLPKLKQNGHRVLLFSQFTSMLDLLEDYCELRGYQFVRLDGETNRVKRRLDVRRYNAPNSPLFIFLISTRAGGLGLNLATADTVILYDSDWNPQVDLQAMERAHRIGQLKPVRVFRLVCEGSVEERMVSRAEKKLFLNAMVAEADPDEALREDDGEDMTKMALGGTSMSKSEVASLIRFGANAVYRNAGNDAASSSSGDELQQQQGMTDAELNTFLEMEGRDQSLMPLRVDIMRDLAAASAAAEKKKLSAAALATAALEKPVTFQASSVDAVKAANEAEGSGPVEEDAVPDAFEAAQKALKDRMENLKEVDLRQLGGVTYNPFSSSSSSKKRQSTEDDDAEAQRMDPSEAFAAAAEAKKAAKAAAKAAAQEAMLAELDLPSAKRVRTQRIIMVDAKGSGYGGLVPMLAQQKAEDETIEALENGTVKQEVQSNYGGRQWTHYCFCVLCGKNVEDRTTVLQRAEEASKAAVEQSLKEQEKAAAKQRKYEQSAKGIAAAKEAKKAARAAKKAEEEAAAAAAAARKGRAAKSTTASNAVPEEPPAPPTAEEIAAAAGAAAAAECVACAPAGIKCAHCPWSFHNECLKTFGTTMGGAKGMSKGMPICPHHRCAVCSRSTQSAGGMLFRCTGCLTAYCEDCLPQEEIDGIGRCRRLEDEASYNSKQSYYIKCPSCCIKDGSKPLGVLGSAGPSNNRAAAGAPVAPGAIDYTAAPLTRGTSTGTSLLDGDNVDSKNSKRRSSAGSGLRKSGSVQSLNGGGGGDGDEDVDDDDVGDDVAEDEEEDEEEEAEPEFVPIKTQLMRIHWDQVLPTPPPTPPPSPPKAKKGGKKGKANDDSDDGSDDEEETPRRGKGKGGAKKGKNKASAMKRKKGGKKGDDDDDEEDSDDDDEEEEEDSDEEAEDERPRKKGRAINNKEKPRAPTPPPPPPPTPAELELESLSGSKVTVPAHCTLKKALSICLSHPVVLALYRRGNHLDNNKTVHAESMSKALMNHATIEVILGKIDKGRYRTAAAFVADVKHSVEVQVIKGIKTANVSAEALKADVCCTKSHIAALVGVLHSFMSDHLEPRIEII